MPESSDNPEGDQTPPERPRAADPVAPAPRAPKSGPSEAPPTGQINLQDLLALARTLSGSSAKVEGTESVRGTISRDQRKFSRAKSSEAEAGEILTRDGSDPLTLPVGDPDSATGALRDGALPGITARTRRRVTGPSRGPGLLVPAAIILTLAGFIAAGWFIARLARPGPETHSTASASAPRPETHAPPRSLTARANELADKIAEAAKNNESAKALALCVLARSEGVNIPGLTYQEARFAAATADYPAAAIGINRSLDANEEVSASYLLQAGILARTGKREAVLRGYEAAAAAAPFEPRPFFFWGESLRRFGRPQAALVRLEEAVSRATDSDLADFYRFKERLTLIELDRAPEFADDLKAKLALPTPPPDWILTAAALELHKGDFPAASRFLDRAAAALTPAEMESRLRDFYFFGFAREPALAKYFERLLKLQGGAPVSSPAPAASPSPSAAPVEAPPQIDLPPP